MGCFPIKMNNSIKNTLIESKSEDYKENEIESDSKKFIQESEDKKKSKLL